MANPGLFAELRRRRVLRTLALYIVAAWVLMQVADVVFPALDIPEQAIRYLLLAAVLGFPVALVFAWLFNITPEGIRRTGRFEGGDAEAVESLQGKDYAILGALAVVLGLIVYGAVDRVADAPVEIAEAVQSDTRPVRSDGPPMVAVLPFTFRGAGDDAAFFAGGVHDDLLTQLSQLAGLRVISRTSVLKYENTTKTIPVIGRELGADAILEGGVQLAGGQIRINAQLIDARSDEHLWAETFDRELTPASIFAVQAEIARAISTALDAALSDGESSDLAVIPTSNMAAYRAYHQAMLLINDLHNHERGNAKGLLEQAVALDPGFTRAIAELVGLLTVELFYEADAEQVARVEAFIDDIAKVAPNSIDHLMAQSFYAYYIVRDYERADQLIGLASARAPSETRLLTIQSWIKKRKGDFEGWVDAARRGRTLEPNNPMWTPTLLWRLALCHRYEEALQEVDGIADPSLNTRLFASLLSLREHRDLQRQLADLKALIRDEQPPADHWIYGALFEAELAVRDFAAAESILGEIRQAMAGKSDIPAAAIPVYLSAQLELYLATNQAARLDTALSEARHVLGLNASLEGAAFDRLGMDERLLLLLAAGDQERADTLFRELAEAIDDDIATMISMRSTQCAYLALAVRTSEAVACLRAGIEQPSDVIPFYTPLLPEYDHIRAEPEFQQLLRDLRDQGWLSSESL